MRARPSVHLVCALLQLRGAFDLSILRKIGDHEIDSQLELLQDVGASTCRRLPCAHGLREVQKQVGWSGLSGVRNTLLRWGVIGRIMSPTVFLAERNRSDVTGADAPAPQLVPPGT